MAHFLPPEHVRQVNKLEWPNGKLEENIMYYQCDSVTVGRCDSVTRPSDILLNKVIIGHHFHSIFSFVTENNISNQTI